MGDTSLDKSLTKEAAKELTIVRQALKDVDKNDQDSMRMGKLYMKVGDDRSTAPAPLEKPIAGRSPNERLLNLLQLQDRAADGQGLQKVEASKYAKQREAIYNQFI